MRSTAATCGRPGGAGPARGAPSGPGVRLRSLHGRGAARAGAAPSRARDRSRNAGPDDGRAGDDRVVRAGRPRSPPRPADAGPPGPVASPWLRLAARDRVRARPLHGVGRLPGARRCLDPVLAPAEHSRGSRGEHTRPRALRRRARRHGGDLGSGQPAARQRRHLGGGGRARRPRQLPGERRAPGHDPHGGGRRTAALRRDAALVRSRARRLGRARPRAERQPPHGGGDRARLSPAGRCRLAAGGGPRRR
jgi:hypothetical protein